MSLERKARAYFGALEGGATGDDLAAFFHPDVVQHTYASRLSPSGAQRELGDILRAAEAGVSLMERQIYDVHTVTEVGDRVVVEYTLTAYPREPLGSVRPGETIRARVCQVLEFEDGLIIRQRSYECFDPF